MTRLQIDVTLAWLAGDMSNAEAAKALRIKSSRNVYAKMGTNMRELYRLGRIKRLTPLKVRGTVS
jgi:hypothetical protein